MHSVHHNDVLWHPFANYTFHLKRLPFTVAASWFLFDCSLEFKLFLLEELRERKFDGYARKIQKAYRMYKSRQYFAELKQQGKSSIQVLSDVTPLLSTQHVK